MDRNHLWMLTLLCRQVDERNNGSCLFNTENYYACLPGFPFSFSAFFIHRSVPRVQQTPRFRELKVKEDRILTSSSRPERKTLERPRKNKNKKKKKGGEKPENAAWPGPTSPSVVPLRPTLKGEGGSKLQNHARMNAHSLLHPPAFIVPASSPSFQRRKRENRGKKQASRTPHFAG